MAFTLYLRSKYSPPANNPSSIHRISERTMLPLSAPNKARHKIDKAAEVISATTAGRSAESTICTPLNFLYL